jgi:hypothetical protein
VSAVDRRVMVCKIGDYGELPPMRFATVIVGDRKVAECYRNEDAQRIGRALSLLFAEQRAKRRAAKDRRRAAPAGDAGHTEQEGS